jgi:hypothetical protein
MYPQLIQSKPLQNLITLMRSEIRKLIEDSDLVVAQCEALRQQLLVEADIQRGFYWHQEEFLREAKRVWQQANEVLSVTSWQRRFFLLDAKEAEEVHDIWHALKQGFPGAPLRLAELPEPTAQLILDALMLAMDNRKTAETLLSTLAHQSVRPE